MPQLSLFNSTLGDLSLGPKSDSTDCKTYINSPDWKKKRERAFRLLGRKCQKCGKTTQLEVHHLTYDNLYDESVSDVEIVCKGCHPVADDQRSTEKGYNTWLRNRYGEWADHYKDEVEYEKFMNYRYRDTY